MFHGILKSKLPPPEKNFTRLAQEAQAVIGAGTLTTSITLSACLVYLLGSPSCLQKLKTELAAAIPDPCINPDIRTLEQLQYLKACIQESLRLSYGGIGRLQRIARYETLAFNDGRKEWKIQPGTPCSMSGNLVHHSERIFPDSATFRPERWLENPRLDRFLMSFSKGSRQCLGINLAYAEIFLMVGSLFRRYGSKECQMTGDDGVLELFETGIKDAVRHDRLGGRKGQGESKGVRIRVCHAKV